MKFSSGLLALRPLSAIFLVSNFAKFRILSVISVISLISNFIQLLNSEDFLVWKFSNVRNLPDSWVLIDQQ